MIASASWPAAGLARNWVKWRSGSVEPVLGQGRNVPVRRVLGRDAGLDNAADRNLAQVRADRERRIVSASIDTVDNDVRPIMQLVDESFGGNPADDRASRRSGIEDCEFALIGCESPLQSRMAARKSALRSARVTPRLRSAIGSFSQV
jgi:hypothetical protein